MNEFIKGDKVECLKGITKKKFGRVLDSSGDLVGKAKDPRYPEKGGIYTVRHVNDEQDLILLEEVRNDHLTDFIRGGLEPGFASRHFRLAPLPKKREVA